MSSSTYFTNLENQLPLCQTCAELQAVVAGMFAPLKTLMAEVNTQLTALEAFAALMTPPTDLNSLITWVTSFINTAIGPQAAAHAKLVAQLAQLSAEVAALTTAIHNAAAQIEGCVVSVPPL
jgi:hypothetical protein